jgi:hypothetical protein
MKSPFFQIPDGHSLKSEQPATKKIGMQINYNHLVPRLIDMADTMIFIKIDIRNMDRGNAQMLLCTLQETH